MKKFLLRINQLLSRVWSWLCEKTTVTGILMLVGSGLCLWYNIISPEIGYMIMGSGVTLLLPENSTAQRIGQALLIPVVAVLSKNNSIGMTSKTSSKKPNT